MTSPSRTTEEGSEWSFERTSGALIEAGARTVVDGARGSMRAMDAADGAHPMSAW